MGATWVGKEDEKPAVMLDRAITFAPSGKVVVSALASLRKGGVLPSTPSISIKCRPSTTTLCSG